MRILFLSNFYPPARPGGYTQWCYEVAERLRERGHTIGVLTSRHEREKASGPEQDVYRVLYLEGDLFYYRPRHFFTSWRQEQRENLALLQEVVDKFTPDVLFVWGMWAMSRALPARAETLLPGRVVYYLSDYWPSAPSMHATYWQAAPRHWYMRPPKLLLRYVAGRILQREATTTPRFEHAICVSHAVKRQLIEAGVPLQEARVIHGGTDVARFLGEPEQRRPDGQLRLLYAGQLVDHKGVHTAVEAMAQLVSNRSNGHGAGAVQLTIMGSGHPEYEARLRGLVAEAGLHDAVRFRSPVTREEIPSVLRQYDALVFPSIYEEPLARMTQEAMAAGMVVIGTTTGGTEEILEEGETGLTFPAGDAWELARQIRRLLEEPELAARLAEAGRKRVVDYFNLERMTGEIESYLRVVAAEPVVGETPPAEQAVP